MRQRRQTATKTMNSTICSLCFHDMELTDQNGYSSCNRAMSNNDYLCHADDHDCYTLWTLYHVRKLEDPVGSISEVLEKAKRHAINKAANTVLFRYQICCLRCKSHIKIEDWHDCLGIHDEERFILWGKLPRSAFRRLRKKYGSYTSEEIYTMILEKYPEKYKKTTERLHV